MGSRTQVYFDGEGEQSVIYCHNHSNPVNMIPWLEKAYAKAHELSQNNLGGLPLRRGPYMASSFVSIQPQYAAIENDLDLHGDLDNFYVVRFSRDGWEVGMFDPSWGEDYPWLVKETAARLYGTITLIDGIGTFKRKR